MSNRAERSLALATGRCDLVAAQGANPGICYGLALVTALGIHAAILFGWHQARIIEQLEFGIESADSSVEVSLVAAPPAEEEAVVPVQELAPPEPEMTIPPVAPEAPTPPVMVPEKTPEMTIPIPEAPPKPIEAPKPRAPQTKPSPVAQPKPIPKRATGDGSSAKPGNDAITARASAGALSAKPGYLRNPNPAYPEQARAAGQQGVVRLKVNVNERGGVTAVQVTASSGFPLLDERARSTVAERWAFKPARVDGVAIPSEVVIPIRFTLGAK